MPLFIMPVDFTEWLYLRRVEKHPDGLTYFYYNSSGSIMRSWFVKWA